MKDMLFNILLLKNFLFVYEALSKKTLDMYILRIKSFYVALTFPLSFLEHPMLFISAIGAVSSFKFRHLILPRNLSIVFTFQFVDF